MWKRFLSVLLKTTRVGFNALLAATTLVLFSVLPSFSQEPVSNNNDQFSRVVDPLTRAVEENPLTLIRIAALSLKEASHQGEALSGLVSARYWQETGLMMPQLK